ncbi:MAG: hypothetical protein QM766_07315 [Burkholderiaceae bacterium]
MPIVEAQRLRDADQPRAVGLLDGPEQATRGEEGIRGDVADDDKADFYFIGDFLTL